jgi:hypothetical protein
MSELDWSDEIDGAQHVRRRVQGRNLLFDNLTSWELLIDEGREGRKLVIQMTVSTGLYSTR